MIDDNILMDKKKNITLDIYKDSVDKYKQTANGVTDNNKILPRNNVSGMIVNEQQQANMIQTGYNLINPGEATIFDTKLSLYNLDRIKRNLPMITRVICRICKSENNHFTANCPNLRCYICKGKHLTKLCNFRFCCQYCESYSHTTYNCTTTAAINARLSSITYCQNCHLKGHLAKDCHNNNKFNYNKTYYYNNNKFRRNYNNNNFNRNTFNNRRNSNYSYRKYWNNNKLGRNNYK